MAAQKRNLKEYPPPAEEHRLVIGGGRRFAHAVDPNQVAFPYLCALGAGPVLLKNACCIVPTSPWENDKGDQPTFGGQLGEEFVLQGEGEKRETYPKLSRELLSKCLPGNMHGQVSHREYLASKLVQRIVAARPVELLKRYVVFNGLCHNPHTLQIDEDSANGFQEYKIGILFDRALDKSRGFDGVTEDGSPYFVGASEPDDQAVGSLVFMLRPGVDEAHDPSFDQHQQEEESVLSSLQDSQPWVLHQFTKADLTALGSPPAPHFFRKYNCESYEPLDVDALHKASRELHGEAGRDKWVFSAAYREVPDMRPNEPVGKKWETYPPVTSERSCYGFLADPAPASDDAQMIYRILKCLSEPGRTFSSTSAPAKLYEASALAKRKILEEKVEAAEQQAALWREKYDQQLDKLADKSAELETALRATKRIKRGEVAVVEDGCFLVAAPGSDVFLTQQGPDKLPLPLSLPTQRPAQVVIPGVPASMPQF